MVNNSVVLTIRSDFDSSTHYGAFYLAEVVQYAKNLGYEVVDITGTEVTTKNVRDKIDEYDPAIVIFDGHGCVNLIQGSLTDDIAWISPGCSGREHSDDNVDFLADRTVFLLACDTDNISYEIAQKAKTVIAFQEIWGWISDNQTAPLYSPQSDKYAVAYFASINEMLKSLLDKASLKNVAKSYVDSISYWLQYWKTSIDAKAEMVMNWLIIDKNSLVVYEDGKLTLTTEEKFNPLIIAAAGLGALLLFTETVERTTSLFGEK